jgi:hypothetical protein
MIAMGDQSYLPVVLLRADHHRIGNFLAHAKTAAPSLFWVVAVRFE